MRLLLRLPLAAAAALAVLAIAAPRAAAGAQPALQLTALGATLSPAQRAQLKAAAQRVISGGANRWPSYTRQEPGDMQRGHATPAHSLVPLPVALALANTPAW